MKPKIFLLILILISIFSISVVAVCQPASLPSALYGESRTYQDDDFPEGCDETGSLWEKMWGGTSRSHDKAACNAAIDRAKKKCEVSCRDRRGCGSYITISDKILFCWDSRSKAFFDEHSGGVRPDNMNHFHECRLSYICHCEEDKQPVNPYCNNPFNFTFMSGYYYSTLEDCQLFCGAEKRKCVAVRFPPDPRICYDCLRIGSDDEIRARDKGVVNITFEERDAHLNDIIEEDTGIVSDELIIDAGTSAFKDFIDSFKKFFMMLLDPFTRRRTDAPQQTPKPEDPVTPQKDGPMVILEEKEYSIKCPDGTTIKCTPKRREEHILSGGKMITLEDGTTINLNSVSSANSPKPVASISVMRPGKSINKLELGTGEISVTPDGVIIYIANLDSKEDRIGILPFERAMITVSIDESCKCPKKDVLVSSTVDTWQLDDFTDTVLHPDTQIITGDIGPSALIERLDNITTSRRTIIDFIDVVEESDTSVPVDEIEIFITPENFPILDKTNISDIKLVPDRSGGETEYDIFLNGEKAGETDIIEDGDTEPIIDINWDASYLIIGNNDPVAITTEDSQFTGDIVINLLINTMDSIETSQEHVTFSVDGDTVVLDEDVIIAERHSPLGLNFMVRMGTGGVGSTISELNENSEKGGIIQYKDFDRSGELIFYYVTDVTGPNDRGDDGTSGTVLLTKAGTNKKTKLTWTASDSTDSVTYGQVEGYDIYAYDFVSYPDGLAFEPASTTLVSYETVVGDFTGSTDWTSYSKLIFSDGGIDLSVVDDEIVIAASGFTGDIKSMKHSSGSVTLFEGEGQTIRIFAETEDSDLPESIVLDKADYAKAMQKGYPLMMLGKSSVTELITSVCGRFVYPEASDEGIAEYDRGKMVALIEGTSTDCPLSKPSGTNPIVTFVKYE